VKNKWSNKSTCLNVVHGENLPS